MGTHVSNRDIYFHSFTLGDAAVVELLLSYRWKYDDNLYLNFGNISESTGAHSVNTEVITTYIELDRLIKNCKFDEREMKIIKMLGHGYTLKEISIVVGTEPKSIKNKFKTIIKNIVKENEWQWRKWAYQYKLELENIHCTKCGELLPATTEFFNGNFSKKTGLESRCKKCSKN